MRTALSLFVPLCTLLSLAIASPAPAAPAVVVSIKPIHALVAGVMEGIGTPRLLVRGAASAHSYSLRPSDARALGEAKLVFLVGEGLETYLTDPLASLAGRARIVELAEVEGVVRLDPREGGDWEAHDHGAAAEGPADEHGHAAYDPHLWLDPDNARSMVAAVAATLSEADPAHAAAYRSNARRMTGRLAALDRELAAALAPVRDIPFIVFHDAYQYFERRYGLSAVGSLTVSPERRPGARRLLEIRQKIDRLGVRCVFAEPQFEPTLVETVTEGTGARVGTLDPLGAALPAGPDLYFAVMRGLAESLKSCLAAGG